MSFYYFSFLGAALALLLGICAAGVFWLLWRGVLKRNISARAFVLSLPVFLLLPWFEEFWIAYHFDRFCRKDAGIFVHRVVEADGYFDATARLRRINNPVLAVTAEEFDRRGFKYYEMSLADPTMPQNKVAHFKRVSGKWVGTTLERPIARYHYRRPQSHTPVAYKIKAFEWTVEDVMSSSVIAREKAYAREAHWLYIGLDRPTRFCAVFGSHGERLTGGLYRVSIKPSK
jgi:hypothetical protein